MVAFAVRVAELTSFSFLVRVYVCVCACVGR